MVVAVLHATTIILAPILSKISVLDLALFIINSEPFGPYGAYFESEIYKVDSFGIKALISFQIERPPAPESKIPIGFELIL